MINVVHGNTEGIVIKQKNRKLAITIKNESNRVLNCHYDFDYNRFDDSLEVIFFVKAHKKWWQFWK